MIFSGFEAAQYLLWLIVLVWLVSVLLTLYVLNSRTPLAPTDDSAIRNDAAPFVSILVAARNEEHRVLAQSIRSILAQDYEQFEVIAVDDRSTDATASILKSLAAVDDRLKVIEGKALPTGWLGKPYAMHQALTAARGEWILATDADMLFDRAALRTAIAATSAREADALTLIPNFETGSFWERVMIPNWVWVMLMFAITFRINNPKTQGALGIGGFFLMRRKVLDQLGGYERLKDEVLEDVRLAEMIKRSGGILVAEYAPRLVSTRMYRTFAEMWESCTKSWFAGMKFSLAFAMVGVLWVYLIAVVPPLVTVASAVMIVTGASAEVWEMLIPAAAGWALQIVVLMIVSVKCEISSVYGLTAPLGLALLYGMLLDSSLRITVGKGVMWKGRRVYDRGGVSPPQLGCYLSRVSQDSPSQR